MWVIDLQTPAVPGLAVLSPLANVFAPYVRVTALCFVLNIFTLPHLTKLNAKARTASSFYSPIEAISGTVVMFPFQKDHARTLVGWQEESIFTSACNNYAMHGWRR